MSLWFRWIVMSTVVVGLAATMSQAADKAVDKAKLEFFEKKIRPVLVAQCYECHSAKSKIVQANLYLDTREGIRRGGDSGPAVVPGEIETSLLMNALRFDGLEMPPKGMLSEATIADFATWIEAGAVDPRDGTPPAAQTIDIEAGRKHWAFQPLSGAAPPKVADSAWPRTDVDRYVLARLEAEKLKPAPDADPELLLRRLSFDLIGLPPTVEELDEFVRACSPSPNLPLSPSLQAEGEREREGEREKAFAAAVDRLLASPQFGERWGRHWLDVARYAESSGKERNVPFRAAWRYRDYVIDAFNADMPYDQFIREQLAGDLLTSTSTAERDRGLIATGFLTIGPQALTERVPEQFLLDVADEQLDTTCRTFLASTAACARCHDHKFDPIPTTDYYALIGIFRSTENVGGVRPLRREFSYAHAVPLGDAAVTEAASRDYQPLIAKLEKELDELRNEGRDANKTKDPAKMAEARRREAEGLQRLTDARARAEAEGASSLRFAMAVRDRAEPMDYAVRIRGELADLGPVVPRGFLTVVSHEKTPKPDARRSGRLELAEWIADRNNPLTARVMVNRLWQHVFGTALVDSVDNFGLTGDKPSHPELLDYLARDFMEHGWSIKHTLRQMLLSRAYQMSDLRDPEAYERDPGNRLLWRFARRRLEAEPIRDAMLAVSGELDLRRPFASSTLTVANVELGSSARLLAADDSPRHRAVYLPMFRSNVPEMLALFDMADPSLVTGRREVTSVATQALYLMNGKFTMDRARKFAERTMSAASDQGARIAWAFRSALARMPSVEETQAVATFIANAKTANEKTRQTELDAWTDVCHALLCSAEFLYVR